MPTPKRLYDAKDHCHTSSCCPAVDELSDGRVRLHDPDKPERGEFIFTREEYNALLTHGQPA